ncbi:MarR family transcriptional regulator [Barrientosiimonas marina]|uniref:MarR family winged helix-turn-helix transcriptional regulator n=1 Tax=Lentibacillus kimchii TaxID=1542911 RepID=A0ABW2URB6_9BACI
MNDSIFHLIRLAERFNDALLIRFYENYSHPIGISSILALHQLHLQGPSKPTAVAKELGYTPGSITNVANKLINQDYAVRQYDEQDRRKVLLAITEQGEQALTDAQQTGHTLRQALFETLTDKEVEQFLSIYEKLLQQLEK